MIRYTLFVTPAAWSEVKRLPGNVRQRAKRAITGLADDPRPPVSMALNVPDIEAEIRRLRLDHWRVVYAVTEANHTVDVLAVRKRPPYDYGDLQVLIAEALESEEE